MSVGCDLSRAAINNFTEVWGGEADIARSLGGINNAQEFNSTVRHRNNLLNVAKPIDRLKATRECYSIKFGIRAIAVKGTDEGTGKFVPHRCITVSAFVPAFTRA